mmetsp:Transcript_13596/g.22189  ORF Transcript_13596/g.22189 Transcript_13596/m.22189 type:complete len:243 (+) Transcript_13596:137-865(+)|eukprot:CAMPEP_0203791428 /NCGR_PEP_ID=MMETSP0100_2-20121128/4629_1 /ASSEMBLY_ACC=CAM_ASM_000210 /TAXON_ID=96639 /ORGANISM=" , Strain NY0313808BC1" /LENGTH=242 /DNA_ID=CAMNT_0050694745 /DNA_START=73 /DNA_END=801 /DNA_ORIENTATION=-
MGFATLISFALFAFGPAMVVFFVVVAKRSQLVILTVTSAFFCLLAMSLSGFLWKLIPNNARVAVIIVAVSFIDMSRNLFVSIYIRGERHVKGMVDRGLSPFSDFSSGIASGLGFGVMYTLMMYGGVFQAALSVGDFFMESCPTISGYIVTAIIALLYQILHICLMILTLDAFRCDGRAWHLLRLLLLTIWHHGISLLGLLNDDASIGCKVGLPAQTFMIVLCILETIRVTRSKSYGIVDEEL